MTLSVAALDALSAAEARRALSACCGSAAWLNAMELRRPFGTADALFQTADDAWSRLSPADWLEAFSHHPRIGERRAAAPVDAASRAWSAGEQARALEDDAAVRAELTRGQQEYEARFGHVFLICATGRTAGEMLDALRARLRNEPGAELRVAAEEQRKITRLRLEKLIGADHHAGTAS